MPRTRYGKSPWIEEFPKTRRPMFPRFRGDLTVPVVVIGGGLTGCATAWGLAAAGVGVVLVEEARLGAGASGRGSGLIGGAASSAYLAFEKTHGRRVARAVFEAKGKAVRELAATAKRLGIKPAVEIHDGLRVAHTPEQEKRLQREAAAREAVGLDAPWVKAAAVLRETGRDALGAIRARDAGHVNPYSLTLGFAAAAAKRKAAIFEGSPVRKLRTGRDRIELTLAGGTITAGTVIVCTGEPTALHTSLARHFKPEERYVVLTEPVPASMRRAFGRRTAAVADDETPSHTIWWTSGDRLAVSGGDQARTPVKGRDKVWVQRTGQLMYDVLRMYPAMAGLMPAYGWDVPVSRTADDVMMAGPHRNFPRQLFAWGAEDAAQAFLASQILVRHVRGEALKSDPFFSFTRG